MRWCLLTDLRRPGAWLVLALAAVTSLPACGLLTSGPDHTYYISASGDDSAAGTSPSTAWRTLKRADAARFRAGDRLLLRGGDRFIGQLRLGSNDAGKPRNPVTIGSYGSGGRPSSAPAARPSWSWTRPGSTSATSCWSAGTRRARARPGYSSSATARRSTGCATS